MLVAKRMENMALGLGVARPEAQGGQHEPAYTTHHKTRRLGLGIRPLGRGVARPEAKQVPK